MNRLIMIVEDDITIRENLKELLEMEGYSVLMAQHGKDALDQLRALHLQGAPLPSGVLLDLNMPVMSGREFLSTLSAENKPLSSIRVIVMTAVPDAGAAGAMALVRKPIDLDELMISLGRLVEA